LTGQQTHLSAIDKLYTSSGEITLFSTRQVVRAVRRITPAVGELVKCYNISILAK